ncbi:aminopeptidase [Basidiobolus meristosporus CBS 931.73]|uniref:Peptide hydrolase n=1 Tax=Basidiobolus meristosporus CBS 931.73 TaxID=1314790 RepID=A0A1Y1YHS5_9FUNG|nr:aminopeptidase [Basidiobolus meristosporus CBS 931.73]|eukprot:ORX97525.1 aminopeptidase [Basidiobolus meristosporus CBS 931.73]
MVKFGLLLSLLSLGFSTEVLSLPTKDLRLVKYSKEAEAKWVSETDIEQLIVSGARHFIDITNTQGLESLPKQEAIPIPTQLSAAQDVKKFIDSLTTSNMQTWLSKFVTFNNRYYRSQTGADSSNWLFQQVQAIASSNPAVKISVRQVSHSWVQKSVVARIEGASGNNETVILGAHQDSINQQSPSTGRAPGADDDGSGTVTILEAFRSFVQGGLQPKRPIEFHWYAAEEGGLLGSGDIAQQYKKAGTKVIGMLQSDMTGFNDKRGVIGVVTDNVDPSLTAFLKKIIASYSTLRVGELRCGYGCSDHASWSRAGYPSAFHFESDKLSANPYIHTARDTIDTVDYNHMLQFARVVVGFAYELSESA